ncbi:alpha-1,2-fucosyltransferase [Chryseobacterium sp. RLHN22]|uniref:alpha-1,2-fucosyltransferase n=1 Tax=Chryseobacterium sp. RLHN22 TaxID=3437885 RepID=UPI003D9BD5AB
MIAQQKGNMVSILHTETMDYWLKFFPALRNFVISPEQLIKKVDNLDWFNSYYQQFGNDFTKKELNYFIQNILLTNSILDNIEISEKTIINIRRGDYYSTEKKLPSSFDQNAYLNEVIEKFPKIFNYPIEIVSDDVEWCKENLNFPYHIKSEDIFFKKDSTPIEDFKSLCSARNLVITNSTFSYWGGYICKFLSNKNTVIAPNFASTLYENSTAYQLHPEWEIIDVLHLC